MLTVRYKVENNSALIMLMAFENIWNIFCKDTISSETAKSYYSFIKNIERDINMPRIDNIKDYEVFIVDENVD